MTRSYVRGNLQTPALEIVKNKQPFSVPTVRPSANMDLTGHKMQVSSNGRYIPTSLLITMLFYLFLGGGKGYSAIFLPCTRLTCQL